MSDSAPMRDEGELGRGGDGTVRLVLDEVLDRRVARKTAANAASPEAVARFTREARMHARLEHPNIPPLYAYGVDDRGSPWFTMRRIEGRVLHEVLRGDVRERAPQTLQEHIEVFLKVCDAVAYAHARGVIHRDLKPHNVILGEYGEVYLVDWGSGMVVDGPRDPQGIVYGTLAYCAPEQARGDNAQIDERTDVFGLGALLYQVLTHHAPYETRESGRAGLRDLLQQAQHALVRPVDAVVGKDAVPRALARVAMKAMSLAPQERYASAAALKADVQQFTRSAWRFRTATYAAGAEIVREGEPGTEAFIVLRGACQVIKTDAFRSTVLRTLGPGEVFGETAALTGLPRSATIRALDEVRVAVITLHDLQEHLALDSWSGRIVKTLADRFREADERRTALERARHVAALERALLVAIGHARGQLTLKAARDVARGVNATDSELDALLASSDVLERDARRGQVRLRAPAVTPAAPAAAEASRGPRRPRRPA